MEFATDLSPILVVDDDKVLVAELVELFGDKSIAADHAHSGRDAMAVLKKHQAGHYKAILVDIDMETPEAGLDILGDIRGHDPHLPIIYLSAYVKDDRLVDAIRKGAVQMVMKPVPFPALYCCVMSGVCFSEVARERDGLRALAERSKRVVITELFIHNIKNLAMAGQLYLRTNPPAVPQAGQCFDGIQDQIQRIIAMTRKPSEGDVADLIGVGTKVLEELAANPKLSQDALSRVKFSPDGGLPQLQIKPEMLAAVLGEVIYNAIVHNSGRSVSVTVLARAVSSKHVQVRVEDDGKGVPPERRSTMFHVQPEQKEHGFGLPYCYEVLRIHGGDIRYEPGTAGGGAFVFTVPVHRIANGGRADA